MLYQWENHVIMNMKWKNKQQNVYNVGLRVIRQENLGLRKEIKIDINKHNLIY